MSNRDDFFAVPASREPVTLLSVDRAVSELRRGLSVVIGGAGGKAVLVRAAEAATAKSLADFAETARSQPLLAITARRASFHRAETGRGDAPPNAWKLAGGDRSGHCRSVVCRYTRRTRPIQVNQDFGPGRPGVDVVERVAHAFPPTGTTKPIWTKAVKGGYLFR